MFDPRGHSSSKLYSSKIRRKWYNGKKVTWQLVHLTLGSEVAMQCSVVVRIKTLPYSQKRVNAFLVISYGL